MKVLKTVGRLMYNTFNLNGPDGYLARIESDLQGKLVKRLSKGAYGEVWSFRSSKKNMANRRLVVKIMKVENSQDVAIMDNEVTVGTNPKIGGVVGPKIYKNTYDMVPFKANVYQFYVMDDVRSRASNTATTLYDYVQGSRPGTCRRIPPAFYNKLSNILKKMYDAGFYHGDLHGDNVMVVNDKEGNVKSVKIIDYGAFRPFQKGKSLRNKCLVNLLRRVHQDFKMSNNTSLQPFQSGRILYSLKNFFIFFKFLFKEKKKKKK